jgi:hypothetical protein
MLGYTNDDIDKMHDAISKASFYLPPSQDGIKDGLKEVQSFLDGLWSEGYLD